MPANIVKTPADERAWNKAKERAKEEGMADNYAYITSIFEKMTERNASVEVPYAFLPVRAERGRVAFQGLSIAVTPEVPRGPRGCYRGAIVLARSVRPRRSTSVAAMQRALGPSRPAHVAAYVGPNALSPLAVLVRRQGSEAPQVLLGFDTVPEALASYARASGAKGASYKPTTTAAVAAWVLELQSS